MQGDRAGVSRPKQRWRRLGVAGSVAAGLALTGCGSSHRYLNDQGVEQSLAKSVEARQHFRAHVVCPASIPDKAGEKFTCTVVLAAGSATIMVQEVGGAKNLDWSSRSGLVALDTGHVVAAIRDAVRAQRGVSPTVTCPAPILQQTGVKFRCSAVVSASTSRVQAGTYRFEVVETNDYGHVTFVGL